jgi:peptidoglycan/xylan/chitin deacetylase (PgdA/CDA1 family)
MTRSLLDNPQVRAHLDRHLLCSISTTEPRVALTFDDGPHPRHTPQLLEHLERAGVKATFFLVGRRVNAFPDIAREIAARGHEIGNHGFAHVPITLLPAAILRREVDRAGLAIERATGKHPRFFRPPMGWFTARALRIVRKMGYEPVIGSIHPRDSTRPGTQIIVEHVLERVAPGSIIILHDGGWTLRSDRSQSVRAAERLLEELPRRGYRFETLSRLCAPA